MALQQIATGGDTVTAYGTIVAQRESVGRRDVDHERIELRAGRRLRTVCHVGIDCVCPVARPPDV